MSFKNIFCILATISLPFCTNPSNDKTAFEFKKNEKGVELFESGTPVLFYQKSPKLLGGKYLGNNYIHPLYSLDGDTLTQQSPPDHPHHRGVFWAWHQIYINGEQIAEGCYRCKNKL